jgi:hypothetical protein
MNNFKTLMLSSLCLIALGFATGCASDASEPELDAQAAALSAICGNPLVCQVESGKVESFFTNKDGESCRIGDASLNPGGKVAEVADVRWTAEGNTLQMCKGDKCVKCASQKEVSGAYASKSCYSVAFCAKNKYPTECNRDPGCAWSSTDIRSVGASVGYYGASSYDECKPNPAYYEYKTKEACNLAAGVWQ